ncbi:hypothetical protein [Sphingomicrobium marinum]|uniref:hypothetical protein n=1 Tax=Sphingomicrobium marinum TaxID=1227950 RepID=UPI002240A646|nr:hypothetical protein [Sphingomicrobium marinum]
MCISSKFFLVLFGVTAGCAATAQEANPSGGMPDWVSQAKIVAEMEGISVGEAVRRARLQILADRQAEKFANDPEFAGSWIEHGRKNFRVNFAFRGGGAKTIADPELSAASNIENVRYSMKEIQDERRRLTALLESLGIDVGFELIVQRNQLILYPSDPVALNKLIADGSVTPRDFVTVAEKALVRRPEAVVKGAGATNGTFVDPADGFTYGSNCSAGFVVLSGSTRGISTAGHCAKYAGQTQTHRGAQIGTRMGHKEANGLDVA